MANPFKIHSVMCQVQAEEARLMLEKQVQRAASLYVVQAHNKLICCKLQVLFGPFLSEGTNGHHRNIWLTLMRKN